METREQVPTETAGLELAVEYFSERGRRQQGPNGQISASQSQGQQERHLVREDLWRSYYEDLNIDEAEIDPSEMSIAIEYNLLEKAWASFTDTQGKWSKGDTKKGVSLKWAEAHTMEGLRDTVVAAARNLDESHGKTREYFDRFCKNLNSHSAILEVLPNQSQYLSIFCGVVKTLLKASDNYRKTLEGLGKSLAEIGDIVHLSVQLAKLINTSDMREAVSKLYSCVFCFLREAMLWYTDKRHKRFIKSFDQNFYDTFSDLLEMINKSAREIHVRGSIGHHAKVTDVAHITRNIDKKLDQLLVSQKEKNQSEGFQVSNKSPHF